MLPGGNLFSSSEGIVTPENRQQNIICNFRGLKIHQRPIHNQIFGFHDIVELIKNSVENNQHRVVSNRTGSAKKSQSN